MSGVYINMEMPEACIWCPLFSGEWCICQATQKNVLNVGNRKDCPLVHVPDHGELIAKATPKRVGFTGWKGVRDTRYKCPLCQKNVRNDEKYCHKCGQALLFPNISFTPYEQGKRQETIVSWPDDPPNEEE